MNVDWTTIPDEGGKYGHYLASREWALLKRAVRQRSGGSCERCNGAGASQVHHLTYERIYREQLEDLMHVCRGCHAFLSAATDDDPADQPPEARGSIMTPYLAFVSIEDMMNKKRLAAIVERLINREVAVRKVDGANVVDDPCGFLAARDLLLAGEDEGKALGEAILHAACRLENQSQSVLELFESWYGRPFKGIANDPAISWEHGACF